MTANRRKASRRPAAFVLPLVATLIVAAGCAQRGSVHLIPLGNRRLAPTDQVVREVRPDHAWWWQDEDGRLRVALHESRQSIFGKPYGREFNASLLLDEPPAGMARNYRVNRATMRHRERTGYVQLRSASMSGLVTVSRDGEKRLRVQLRLEARQQSFWFFAGWGSDAAVLWVGDFTATPNRTAGERVWLKTEEDKLARTEIDGDRLPIAAPVVPRDTP